MHTHAHCPWSLQKNYQIICRNAKSDENWHHSICGVNDIYFGFAVVFLTLSDFHFRFLYVFCSFFFLL